MPTQAEVDLFWMRRAIGAAVQGRAQGEWPFGAIVVREGTIDVGARCLVPDYGAALTPPTCSTERTSNNPAGHAELHAIEHAGVRNGRLLRGCTLYTTHEPCVMCTGLILQAKLSRVVIGTLRSDRPDLFNPDRKDRCEDLMRRNANPASPILVVTWSPGMGDECLALFDGMVDDAAAA